MSNIAIIPARGGSKRIPGKNIKDFLGKPIIAYSIEAALKSELFDEVMVSTDDEDIAKVAREYGAKVPFMRSRENSGDFSTTVDVLLEVLSNYTNSYGRVFSYGCCIYPTAPFTTPFILKEGFYKIMSKKFDSVFPVVPFSYPIWRGLKIDRDDKVEMIWPKFLNSRSQDLEKVYHDVGQWYWFAVPPFINSQKILNKNSGVIELNELQIQDIDTSKDWKIAEIKYRLLEDG